MSLVVSGKVDTRARAKRLRLFLESMGGMWVKAGQLVALRRDVFMPETCDELSKLQDQAFGFEWSYAKSIIEEDLGSPLETFFSDFDPDPIAAASIGQTHIATLRENGMRVAVKVQRPFISQRFAHDMRYLKLVASWMGRLGVGQQMRWDELIWELEHTLNEELDYRFEASSADRMRKMLRNHDVYAPRVFFRYCSQRVLVLEYLEGPFMSEFIALSHKEPGRVQAWLAANGIDPKKLGERLILSHMQQIFEEELYHADLHPGNILLQRDSRFALIDFGSVGMMEKSQRHRYRLMYQAIAERDFAKTVDMILLMAPPLPHSDIGTLKLLLVRTLRAWAARAEIKSLPYHQKSFASCFNETLKYYQQFGLSADWAFLRLNRADMTLDASLAFLCPDLNHIKLAARYERQARRRLRRRARRSRDFVEGTLAIGAALRQWTENTHFDGEWLRLRAMDFQGRVSKAAYAMSTFLSVVGWLVIAIAALFVHAYVRHPGGISPFDFAWLRETTRGIASGARPVDAAIVAGILVAFVVRKLATLRGYVVAKEFDRPRR
jgi:ubiquinone biosynthesis protein